MSFNNNNNDDCNENRTNNSSYLDGTFSFNGQISSKIKDESQQSINKKQTNITRTDSDTRLSYNDQDNTDEKIKSDQLDRTSDFEDSQLNGSNEYINSKKKLNNNNKLNDSNLSTKKRNKK